MLQPHLYSIMQGKYIYIEGVLGTTYSSEFSMVFSFIFIFYFYLYLYPPDSQESDEGAIHRVSNYPDVLAEMPRYCCPLVI